ncbi:MAG TPA: I78 family peptidase inhibitor [Pseudorhodoferax sp.]|nr:I78 family peptidase inhibitor [Pseudorhodoferax sp.]
MTTRKIPWWAGAVTLLALSGCAGLGAPGAGPGAAPGTPGTPPAVCDAAAAQFALGQSFGPALERELRARSGASIVRWLSPGQAVTMEFNAARLNLTLDGRSRIVRAACG